jgi:hypothetical protein
MPTNARPQKKLKPISATARKLIKDLEENVYCRLRPSKIQGVGIFAIRDIPKGKDPFKSFLPYPFAAVPADAVFDNPKIDSAVKKFAGDMYVVSDGMMYPYKGGLNGIDISFFLNHSEKPNLIATNDGESFLTARIIKKDEELLSDHRTYSENFVNNNIIKAR